MGESSEISWITWNWTQCICTKINKASNSRTSIFPQLFISFSLKLKIQFKISHSSLILEFFETQSCDPKPILNFNNISDFENDKYASDDDDDDDDDDANSDCYDDKENYLNEDNFEDDDVDIIKNLRINSYQHQQQQNSNNNNNCDDEAGLWWDEDNALNELTMSSSFNNYNNSSLADNSASLFTNSHDLDCLENILSTYRFNDSSD